VVVGSSISSDVMWLESDSDRQVLITEHIANAELMATSKFSLPFMYGQLKEREPQA